MKKLFLIPLLLFQWFLAQESMGQSAVLKGVLSDTSNYKPMVFSSVSLIRNDSLILRTQFTNQKSEFHFKEIPADTYRILITRPGYADYEEKIILNENEAKDMGTVVMFSRENLLREVLIKDFSAIKIKGDTTEFLVDSFLVNKSSNVEDLLKRLPGIQVDKNGKITAQGQEVKKVLVDGEEFFGNDPTIATRNLLANNVETVQVFDQKSAQSIQTGVDDGEKEKTINLTLKEDAKKGYFGKVGAGYGTRNDSKIAGVKSDFANANRYEGEAMYNNFRKKRKVSFFSTFSNTEKTGLDWEDREKYMGGNNVEFDEASGYMYSYFESDPNGYNGNGIPQTSFLGGYFSDKIKNDKYAYNFSGTHRETLIRGADKNYTQYILPDTMYFNNQVNTMNNFRAANNFSGKSEIKMDSLSTVVIKANVVQTQFNNQNKFTSENYNGIYQKVNSNERENTSKGQTTQANYSISYNKKFKKLRRNFFLQWDQKINDNQSDGNLLSNTLFYNGGSTVPSEQKLDQLKSMEESGNNFGARASYTEPLNKAWAVVTDFDLHLTQNKSMINTFNKSLSGGYTSRVDSLSNELHYDINIRKGGISFQYITKKISSNFGVRLSQTRLVQNNLIKDTTLTQNFNNLFPSARINYKLGGTKNISFNYNGFTQQPTLQQINPIQDLSNPLLIYKGNPSLLQKFSNNFNLTYNSYKPITGRSIYLSMHYSYTYHDFAFYDEVDHQGRKIYKTVNVDGNQRFGMSVYHYFKIKKYNLTLSQSLDPNISKSSNFINGLANTNNNTNISYDLNLRYDKEEKLGISFSPAISYYRSTTSLRPDVLTQYFTYTFFSYVNVFLPKRFEWMLSGRYNIRQQTSVFKQNNNNLNISAYISRKFLKSESLLVKIGVEDLLNQNIGFERDANSNYINENTYVVLKRYFMFSLTYQFNNGGPKD